MGAGGSFYPLGVGRPIMLSGMISLVLGGLVGTLLMLKYQGIDIAFAENLPGAGFHWFLMIYGFLLSLISVEIFSLLSFEWSGRVAPTHYIVSYLALFWGSIILWIYGEVIISIALVSVNMALLAAYGSSVFLRPSRLGFRPTHYNILLVLTPVITLAVLLLWILQRVFLGSPVYEIGIASLVFPLGAILAVESRDIPLLTGQVGERRSPYRVMIMAGYFLAITGVVIYSARIPYNNIVGGFLAILGSLLAFKDLGLLSSLRSGARGGLVPVYMARYSLVHMVTAFTWLLLGGSLFVLTPLLTEVSSLTRDLAVHAITLGFIFNTIFGVDAVLMYSHAGISLRKVPRPSYIPYILLNTSLILRAIYDLTGIQGITVASAPLTGLAIVVFFLMHNMRLSRLRREMIAMRTGSKHT
ncbi:MAG TPA: hypothetical protein VNL13_09360 [Sulfolobales archaeon]|nr:hypothetical protein [Sulfolobales archaeon]